MTQTSVMPTDSLSLGNTAIAVRGELKNPPALHLQATYEEKAKHDTGPHPFEC